MQAIQQGAQPRVSGWSYSEWIQNPGRSGLAIAAVTAVVPFTWPISLYFLVRFVTGRRANRA